MGALTAAYVQKPYRWREERVAHKNAREVEQETEYAKDEGPNTRVIGLGLIVRRTAPQAHVTSNRRKENQEGREVASCHDEPRRYKEVGHPHRSNPLESVVIYHQHVWGNVLG